MIMCGGYVKQLCVSWWNVENLFDLEKASRTPKLKRVLGRELKGWNNTVLNKKLSQLSKIITQLNNKAGPDILGVCEIESKEVLKKLVLKIQRQRKYGIAHDHSGDSRGIDTAFIYDTDLFEVKDTFSHFIVKRNATRDLFQVNLEIKKSGQLLILIGNHWPARLGGSFDSEPYRIIAGETLAYFHERIVEENGKDVAIIAMGDFNDEPFNRSIVKHALALNNKTQVRRARKPKFYNLMWPLLSKGLGTHYYGSAGSILDQMMISKGLLDSRQTGLSIDPNSIRIERFPEMAPRGKPCRFGRPSKLRTYNENGFSDHFPISVTLEFEKLVTEIPE